MNFSVRNLWQVLACMAMLAIFIESHTEQHEPVEHSRAIKRSVRLANREKSAPLNAEFWYQNAVNRLVKHQRNLMSSGFPPVNKTRRVRNVILFIGDGHGPVSVTASRLYKKEFNKKPIYESDLVADSFPFSGQAKTYSLDYTIPDSAATATAYLTATKTLYGYVGADVTVDIDCKTNEGFVSSIAQWANAERKSAGLVTTVSITHGSPSPLYAHTPHRSHQANTSEGMNDHPYCTDISQQFLQSGRHMTVALGAGEDYFLPNTIPSSFHDGNGRRIDGRNLIQEWLEDRSQGGLKAQHVKNSTQLEDVNPNDVDYLLGLFGAKSLPYMDDEWEPSVPTIAQMTKKAIEVLDKNPNGYFLFVEGGKIDKGHHRGKARRALREAIEMDMAVEQALSMVDLTETLLVVSADHSHTLTMGGYLDTADSVLGISEEIALDSKNFTILQYANGPGAKKKKVRSDVTQEEAIAVGYRQQALVPLEDESHGGEDVGVYAIGPYAELFTGVYEQNYIPIAMACAGGFNKGLPGSLAASLKDICPEPWLAFDSTHDATSMPKPDIVWHMLFLFFSIGLLT